MLYRISVLLAFCVVAVPAARQAPAATNPALAALITQAQGVRGDAWAPILAGLEKIDRATLDLDDQVDFDLLRSHARTRQWEQTELRQWEVDAAGVIGVGAVSGLFLRDGSLPEVNVRSAIAQLRGLANSIRTNRERLTAPARIWSISSRRTTRRSAPRRRKRMTRRGTSRLSASERRKLPNFAASGWNCPAAERENLTVTCFPSSRVSTI